MAIALAAYVFNSAVGASSALRQIRPPQDLDWGWLDHVAVITRQPSGRVSVDCTWGVEARAAGAELDWGALTGALLGVLAGPSGPLASVLGGALPPAVGGDAEVSLYDRTLEEFAAKLQPDTSALVLWGDKNDFTRLFQPFDATLIETTIDGEIARRIRAAAGGR